MPSLAKSIREYAVVLINNPSITVAGNRFSSSPENTLCLSIELKHSESSTPVVSEKHL